MYRQNTDEMLERLLDVAIEHFGEHGFQGGVTRDIARDAQTLMSSITYHFKGKEGLYHAAADRVAVRLGELLAPAMELSTALCGAKGNATQARSALHVLARRLVEVVVGPKHEALVRFAMHERAVSSQAYDQIHKGAMSALIKRWIELLRCVSARPMLSDEAYLRTHAMIGQILAFRTARVPGSKGLAWAEVGARDVEAVQEIIAEHIDFVLDRLSADPSV